MAAVPLLPTTVLLGPALVEGSIVALQALETRSSTMHSSLDKTCRDRSKTKTETALSNTIHVHKVDRIQKQRQAFGESPMSTRGNTEWSFMPGQRNMRSGRNLNNKVTIWKEER